MNFRRLNAVLLAFGICCALHPAWSAPWNQFRGPNGDGVAGNAQLPLTWSETENLAWKTPIHGRAWSSPVVMDQQIWLTTATEDGQKLSFIGVNPTTGAIVRDQQLFEVEKPQFAHKFNSYGSPTPVAEPGRLYVTFGSPGTACIDTKTGNTLWKRTDLICNHYRGSGSSPILYQNLLIMNFDGSDHQFIIALDKRTGKTVWETKRSIDYKDLGPDGKPDSEGDWRKAFATPHIAILDGKTQLLSQGAKAFYSYDPMTGEDLWRIEERTSHSAGTRPVIWNGTIVVPSGWSSGQILAIKPGAKGDVLDVNSASTNSGSLSMVWRSKRNVPKKPSLLVVNDLLFSIDDNGVATCSDPATGKSIWNERIGGNYSASPIATKEHIYFVSEEGKTTVIAAAATFQKLGESQVGDGFMASPAVLDNALILRSRTMLYRVEAKK